MRVAGVRLSDGSAVWLDAGTHEISHLDKVVLDVDGRRVEGVVFVLPHQWLRVPPVVQGAIVLVLSAESLPVALESLPGADLPPLGSRASAGARTGMVTSLDPVLRIVRITLEDGTIAEISADQFLIQE